MSFPSLLDFQNQNKGTVRLCTVVMIVLLADYMFSRSKRKRANDNHELVLDIS